MEALEGLEQVSHVWLLFLFHQALEDKPRLKVRPPRLGGNRSLGVFAKMCIRDSSSSRASTRWPWAESDSV